MQRRVGRKEEEEDERGGVFDGDGAGAEVVVPCPDDVRRDVTPAAAPGGARRVRTGGRHYLIKQAQMQSISYIM